MSDMICRKSMMRCQTPGMCSPHGGCRDDRDKAYAEAWEKARGLQSEMDEIVAERDKLKSENAGLKTGYEAYEQVVQGLKAENERLKSDIEKLRQVTSIKSIFTFSGKLASLRATRGLTQRELAAMTGIAWSMISKYEAGKCRPRLKIIYRLEKALCCPGEFQGASHD